MRKRREEHKHAFNAFHVVSNLCKNASCLVYSVTHDCLHSHSVLGAAALPPSPRFGCTRSPAAHSVPLYASLNQSRVSRTLLVAGRDKGAVPARLLHALPIVPRRADMASPQDGDRLRTSDDCITSGPGDAEAARSERGIRLEGAAGGALRRKRVGLTFVGLTKSAANAQVERKRRALYHNRRLSLGGPRLVEKRDDRI